MKSKKPNWVPLLSTSFLGILNDNFLKKLTGFICIYWVAQNNENKIIAIAGGLFIIPYILLSPYAGYLSKLYLKRKIVIIAKISEIPIMAIASIGFLTNSLYFVLISIFLMGLQSCLFSPAKYGLIRDVGGKKGISFGIGALEMMNFLGNLIGAVIAGLISDLTNNREIFIILLFFTFSLTGWVTSTLIKVQESKPIERKKEHLNPLMFLIHSIKWSRSVKSLNYIVLSLGMFWLAAAMIEMNLITHCPNKLGYTYTQTGWIMAAIAVSIAFGSFLSGYLSNKKVQLGFVPIGGIGFAVNISIIYIFQVQGVMFIILMILASFFAGFYKIPLNSFMQDRVEGRKLGDIIAFNNLAVFLFIFVASGFIFLIENTNTIFLVVSIVIWIMTIIGFIFIPEMRNKFIQFFKKE